MIRLTLAATVMVVVLVPGGRADGPADNISTSVRRIPMPGIDLQPQDQDALKSGLEKLGTVIKAIESRKDRKTLQLLPDIRIYESRRPRALEYHEFFGVVAEVAKATELLKEPCAWARAGSTSERVLPRGPNRRGLSCGYVSKLDGSVQPYGLVIPETYTVRGPAHAPRSLVSRTGRDPERSEFP